MIYPAAMATPSPRPLAESLRRLRRSYITVFAVAVLHIAVQIGAGWWTRLHPDDYFAMLDLVYFGTALILLVGCLAILVHYLAWGRHRVHTTEFLSSSANGEPAFVVPNAIHRWSAMFYAIPAGWSFELGRQLNRVAAGRPEVGYPIDIGIWAAMIALPLGIYFLG